MIKSSRLTIKYTPDDFPIAHLDSSNWNNAIPMPITKYWTGEDAPAGRHLEARLLWSDTALYVRFVAAQTEPLVINETPDLTQKTMFLWNRDVCELFIATDKDMRNRYYEFEIAPTGEWIDLIVDLTGPDVVKDWEYSSGMRSAVRLEKDKVVLAIKIEWTSLAPCPKPGDIWLGNLYRCVGTAPTRGYLAWQPTETKEQNFHVPSKFGEFEFVR